MATAYEMCQKKKSPYLSLPYLNQKAVFIQYFEEFIKSNRIENNINYHQT